MEMLLESRCWQFMVNAFNHKNQMKKRTVYWSFKIKFMFKKLGLAWF